MKILRYTWLSRSWIEPLMDIAQDLRKADLGDLAPSVEWLTLGAVVHGLTTKVYVFEVRMRLSLAIYDQK